MPIHVRTDLQSGENTPFNTFIMRENNDDV